MVYRCELFTVHQAVNNKNDVNDDTALVEINFCIKTYKKTL